MKVFPHGGSLTQLLIIAVIHQTLNKCQVVLSVLHAVLVKPYWLQNYLQTFKMQNHGLLKSFMEIGQDKLLNYNKTIFLVISTAPILSYLLLL